MRKFLLFMCAGLCAASAVGLGLGLFRWMRVREQRQALIRQEVQVEEALLGPWQTVFHNQAAQALLAGEDPEDPNDLDLASYLSPEGILFSSRSAAWDEAKLEELYQELLRNKHGQEIYDLARIIVYPQPDEEAAATHQRMGRQFRLRLKFPCFPRQDTFLLTRIGGVICLYDGDNRTDAMAMASSLSHEYGHHYTLHYMFERPLGDPVYEGSQYQALRQIDPARLRTSYVSASDYGDNHAWYFYEIAAEDYVVLMGSPNARSVVDYYDIRQALEGREEKLSFARNAQVQENLMIPMATTVPSLAAYFYSFVDQAPPVFAPQTLTLDIEPQSVGFDLVGGYQTFDSYEITWDKVYGQEAVYTLVCFDPENYAETLRPIRTVTEGEPASAEIGALAVKRGDMVYSADDKLAQGTKTFAVTVILPDGTMYVSDLLEYTF